MVSINKNLGNNVGGVILSEVYRNLENRLNIYPLTEVMNSEFIERDQSI